MGILSGLEGFGLGGLANADIFGEDKPEQKPVKEKKEEEPKSQGVSEADLIFSKGFTCPCCDHEFKSKTVKIGKARLVDADMDLRPKYDYIDSLKYDVIMCPYCGYAALSRFFSNLTQAQAKLIKVNISQAFQNSEAVGEIYTYDEAIERYKLALANAVVKRARASEKAYICLKLAWVIRGKGENLDPELSDYQSQLDACKKEEEELLHSALDGFIAARQTETYPMCGMDESTVDYMLAVFYYRFGQYEASAKLVSGILTSNTANKRMKDKARNLKDEIVASIKGRKS
ncbi:MAG: DUF2225 domain-containing protein [Lachnospiraceae bacterium]|nr:DUF2225 domain-containing protein [Lachnospiraceae bacterium]